MRVASAIRQTIHHPLEVYFQAVAKWHERHEAYKPHDTYAINHDWRQKLGVSDEDCERTDRLWPVILRTLEAKGIRPGPESYLHWNDGDPAFIQAVWCLIRRLSATKIVETGVAHGVTTRFILEAIGPGTGHLWSIDLPPPSAALRRKVGAAVGVRPSSHWTLIAGSSRRRLSPLLDAVAPIDLFVHDSSHTKHNMMLEMSLAWAALRPGGALVVDDIDLNAAFYEFSSAIIATKLVGEAEPIRPDLRRFNHKGLFGILLKPPVDDGGAG